MAIKDSGYVKWPPKMRGDPTTRNPNVYCHFHRDIGHNIENCRNLRDEIKELIRHGYLKKFIQHEDREIVDRQADQRREAPKSSRRNNQPPQQQSPPEDRPIYEVINMITSGSIVAGCTTATGKTSIWKIENEDENPPKWPRVEDPIYFTEGDACGIQYPHNDALIIKLVIDFEVKQVLVDSRSLVDIQFLEAFDKLQVKREDLKTTDTPLVGFNGEVVRPLDQVTIPIAAGAWPNSMRFKHTFLVVVTSSPYKVHLACPTYGGVDLLLVHEIPNELRSGGCTR
ncbi:PREDICTED: uncharacterized protein LOC104595122 [Nelumbo nucifera]|uniref:Uncharacterized protein LOC104595122 n=1 Tax=Nelumbo nucifera TaxID=4432 RepID=A0A1U7ZZ69_NELNU|nr:PREDICTED: uncharacterized protein LOC104595122 [Nelumbo nucifera]